jgi:bifunctional pyridoxal-dependent enzyme with beta-cystathionase and maltose regulon repressor activities
MKIKVSNESKNEKFKRIASARTQRILDDIRLLGNCSNRTTYEYTENDIDKIFSTIEKNLKIVKSLFNKPKELQFKL